MLISEYGLNPWLLNNKNQTPFELIDIKKYSEIYNKLYSSWANGIFYILLLEDSTIYNNFKPITIFEKLRISFGELAKNPFVKIISNYI
jgi:hypothetical protein